MTDGKDSVFDTAAVNESLAEVKRFDRERYLTAVLSPAPVRPHLLSLYAFNIELSRIPALVSEGMLGRIRLQWWRDTLEATNVGAAPPHPLASALQSALDLGVVQTETLLSLIEGRERDLDETPFSDIDELETYLAGTSGTLLQAAASVSATPRSPEAVAKLGIAYGLVGLARAMPYHAEHGRVWLPLDMLKAHGLGSGDILARRNVARIKTMVSSVAERSRELLDQARGADIGDVGLPALLHGELARRHVLAIEKPRYDPYDPIPPGDVWTVLRLKRRAMLGRM